MLSVVADGEKLKRTLYVSGQNREMWFLTEDGLYEVLMQSRKPIVRHVDEDDRTKYPITDNLGRTHVDDEDKASVAIYEGRQNRNMTIINESGLYSLVLSSKLPRAKKFKRWVTSEVI